MSEVDEIIAKLGLQPLPNEGGFFARTWTGPLASQSDVPAGTAIYFLLTPTSFSALHRLETDEIWHFYAGAEVEHWQLSPADGRVQRSLLGPDIMHGQVPQLIARAGNWQGARISPASRTPIENDSWSLLGCTLAPGWTGRDFDLGARASLIRSFPQAAKVILSLTRL